jgi:hypothetical protein
MPDKLAAAVFIGQQEKKRKKTGKAGAVVRLTA